jgi:transcriptional regulator with XRE-family HTH domain
MEMKIDALKIKQLREARGWSQEHLAEVAGLSARTVQRIEAEGNASPESRMALAAALGVEATTLGQTAEPISPATPSETTASGRPGNCPRHLIIFFIVCTGLVIFDVMNHAAITWSKWPVLGWGIGLLMHWVRWRATPDLPGRR